MPIFPAITIGNSETGHGSLFVRMGFLLGACFNLATVENVVTNIHLGSRLDPGIFSQDTMHKEAEAIMAKAGDAIGTAFDEQRFKAVVDKCRKAQEVPVKPIEAVDFAVSQNIITQESKDSLLAHFLGDAAQLHGSTAFGFAQAVSRFAQDVEEGDAASELEKFAGQIINKPSLVGISVKEQLLDERATY